MLRQLDPASETDRELHLDLSEAIRQIDRKIARLRPAGEPRPEPEGRRRARPDE
jgi:hypothetical protein